MHNFFFALVTGAVFICNAKQKNRRKRTRRSWRLGTGHIFNHFGNSLKLPRDPRSIVITWSVRLVIGHIITVARAVLYSYEPFEFVIPIKGARYWRVLARNLMVFLSCTCSFLLLQRFCRNSRCRIENGFFWNRNLK